MTLRLRKRCTIWALSLVSGSAWLTVPTDAAAQDAVWRASRPLVLRAAETDSAADALRERTTAPGDSGGMTWRIRADILRRLRAGLALAQADVAELERRQQAQRVFRFSDGLQAHAAQTQLTLLAARLTAAEIEAEIRRISRAN